MGRDSPLLIALRSKQEALNIPDGEMARRLDVSRPLWCRVRQGKYPVDHSIRLLRGVVRAFPDLAPETLAFLREGAGDERVAS